MIRDREVGSWNPLSARHFQALTDKFNFAMGILDLSGSEISERSRSFISFRSEKRRGPMNPM
jgi:hypothetical protein